MRVKTLGDVLTEFRHRPEHKSLTPDGTPVTRETAGLLRRRPIESAPVLTDLIGKEGNDLAERGSGAVFDVEESLSKYGHRGDRWTELVLPVLRQMGVEEVMQRTGRSRSTVYEVMGGRAPTYGAPAAKYRNAAVAYARLAEEGESTRELHPYGALYRWLNNRCRSL